MSDNNILSRIVNNGLCTGCGLCEALSPPGDIRMEISKQGYFRPTALRPLSGPVQSRIESYCPGIRVEHSATTERHHPLWGPLVHTRTGFATDAETRREGSSGGVISALAIHLLQTGQIDFVAQNAVGRTDPLANELQLSRSREDVLRAAGSRYAPSAPLSTLRELLATGQRFAVVGKPCDIAGLRRYTQSDPAIAAQIPFMLSFMCAGVPSMQGTYALLDKLGADRTRLASFRYRGDGWPGLARAIQTDGQKFEMDYASSWGGILNRHLQFRCKICPDGTGEFADVTCADAWYGKDGYPDFAERDGRSLVLTRTRAGEALIQDALSAGMISVQDLLIGEVEKMQPYQAERKKVVLGRVIATQLAQGFAPKYRRMGLVRSSLMAGPLEWLRSARGTYRRISKKIESI